MSSMENPWQADEDDEAASEDVGSCDARPDVSDEGDGQESGSESTDGEQAVAQAAPQEVQAHRDLLSEALGMLGGQGHDIEALASQAGVSTSDPSQMSHGDLVSMARTLAQEHPEVLQTVAQRFPEAQGLLGSVLGGGGGQAGGGMLGGLLNRFLGH